MRLEEDKEDEELVVLSDEKRSVGIVIELVAISSDTQSIVSYL